MMRFSAGFLIVTLLTAALTMAAGLHVAPAHALVIGDKETEKRINGGEFSRIEVSGVYELSVKRDARHDVVLKGRSDVLERAHVRINNDTLYLGHQKGRNFRSKKSIEAVITLPMLRALEVSGVVDGRISDVDADDLVIRVSGVGDLHIDGKCSHLHADLSGVGDLDAYDLKCGKVTITVSGVGDARVYADEVLDARVSGIGDLTCYGSPPKVRKNKSFFSSISVH